MKIINILKNKTPVVSFEIFPPKPDTPIDTIYKKLYRFSRLKPDYISITYGASGSRKHNNIEIASKIKKDYNIETMAHFTCVGHNREEINALLTSMSENNLENILALRGDPPKDRPSYDFSKCTYRYASELIKHIRKQNNFCIAAAAYVEGHIESKRISDDVRNLKKKVDEGVDFLVTQLFFDNRFYFDYIERLSATGIDCPLIPGIMPIFSADQIKSICAKSGCSIPAKLVLLMDKYGENPRDMRKAGIEYAASQIKNLINNGAPGIHLYTMNRPVSTKKLLKQADLYR